MKFAKFLVGFVLVAIFAIQAFGAHSALFGGTIKSLSEREAKAFAGYGAAGIGVESVDPGGLAEYFDLKAGDLVLEANGKRTLHVDDLEQALRPKDEQNLIVYARLGRKRTLAISADNPSRVLFVLPPEAVEEADNEYKRMAQETGLTVIFGSELPKSPERFSAIVLLNPKVTRSSAVPLLKAYVKGGGGLILADTIPIHLIDQDDNNEDCALDSIADWFGARRITSTRTHTISESQLVTAMSRPVQSSLRKSDELFSFRSQLPYLGICESDLADLATPLGWWSGWEGNGGYQKGRFAGAFFHRYGEGRVFYQFRATEPNYPKVQQLFVSAIRWAAGASHTEEGQ